MANENKLSKKKFILIILSVILTIVLGLGIFAIHKTIKMEDDANNLKHEINAIKDTIHNSDKQWDDTVSNYNELMHSKAAALAYKIKNNNASYLKMEEYRELVDVENVLVVDKEGVILAKAKPTEADFTKNIFNRLRESFKYDNNIIPVEIVNADNKSLLYYSAAIDKNRMVVIEISGEELGALVANFQIWDQLLKNISVGKSGNVSVIADNSYEIVYSTDKKLMNIDAIGAGLKSENLYDGYVGWIMLNKNRYYAGVAYVDHVYIICMIPESETLLNVYSISLCVMSFIVLIMIVMVIYALMTMEDAEYTSNIYKFKIFKGKLLFNKLLGFRIAVMILVGIIVLFFLDLYVQSLFAISRYSVINANRLEKIEKIITNNNDEYIETFDYYDELLKNQCNIAKNIVEESDYQWDNKKLIELKKALGVEQIDLINKNGQIVASTGTLLGYKFSKDKSDTDKQLMDLLESSSIIVQKPTVDSDGDYYQYAGASIYDPNEGIIGIVRICETANQKEKILAGTSIESILGSVVSDIETVGFAIDKNTNKFIYATDKKLVGRNALDYGFSEKNLYDGFNGFIKVKDETYLSDAVETKDYYIFIGTNKKNLDSNRLIIAGLTVALTGLVVLIIYLFICCGIKVNNSTYELKASKSMPKHIHKRLSEWESLTPEQRLFTIFEDYISLFALIITVLSLIEGLTNSNRTIIGYVLSGKWEQGINIFSFSAIMIAVCVGCVISQVTRKILSTLSHTLKPRGKTICRMLKSASKYIVAIVIIFYSLRILGANPTTLVASAGVLTAVIGLGANSLTSDILAGIFLIFEGEFSVGDMVTIDGWRGKVLDIGIRTTKIENDDFNIKIISNSKMSGIINMSRHLTKSWIDILIDYGESIERVEAVLEKEMPKIKDRVPGIVEGPSYEFVRDLGDNGVLMALSYRCHEKDRPITDRHLQRELRMILANNNINVPYPQITINPQIDYEGRKKD